MGGTGAGEKSEETRREGTVERALAVSAWLALALFYLRTLGEPSLWHDEAWEANYYAGFSPSPWMSRPILYMAGQRFMVWLVGPTEFALRLLPCLAGLVTVAWTWRIARREIGRLEAWIAAALLALGPTFLLLAHQLKHYPFEALATVALLAAYAGWRRAPTGGRAWIWAATAVATFGISFTSPFAIAGIAAVESLEAVARRRALPALARFAAATIFAGAVFVALYATFHAADASEEVLRAYWVDAFVPLSDPASVPAWLANVTFRWIEELVGASSGLAAVALALAGAFAAGSRGRSVFGVLAVILALRVAASAAQVYPYGSPRLSLDLAPLLSLSLACGLAAPLRTGPARGARRLAVAALAYALFYPLISGAVPYATTGWRFEHIRDLVRTIDEERRAGDAIYVHEDTGPAFRFYWRRLGHEPPFEDVVWAPRLREDLARHDEGAAALAERYERVWGLYTHAPREEVEAVRRALAERYDPIRSETGSPDARLDLWRRKPRVLEER